MDDEAEDLLEDTEESDSGYSSEESDQWVVGELTNHRIEKGVIQYRTRWKGYNNPKDDSWVPEKDFSDDVQFKKYWHSKGYDGKNLLFL